MLTTSLIISLMTGLFAGTAAGYLGSFMVLRRMALVGDALSHVALPGIAIALLLHFSPLWGAFGILLVAVVGIWGVEEKTHLPTEALVGVFFTVSLAIGILITPQVELLQALFGDISKVHMDDMILAVVLSVFAIGTTWYLQRNLALGTISKDLANASGAHTRRTNLIFLLMVALVVALGLKVLGVLLMGALVIIPAVAAKNITHRFSWYGPLSAVLGGVSAVSGVWLASLFRAPSGPIVVLVAACFFLASLIKRAE